MDAVPSRGFATEAPGNEIEFILVDKVRESGKVNAAM